MGAAASAHPRPNTSQRSLNGPNEAPRISPKAHTLRQTPPPPSAGAESLRRQRRLREPDDEQTRSQSRNVKIRVEASTQRPQLTRFLVDQRTEPTFWARPSVTISLPKTIFALPRRGSGGRLVKQSLRLLVMSNSEQETRTLQQAFERHDSEAQRRRVDDVASVERAVLADRWEPVVCDASQEHAPLLRSLERVRAKHGDVPFLIITDPDSRDAAVLVLSQSKDEGAPGEDPTRLGHAAQRALDLASEIAALRRCRGELESRRRVDACLRSIADSLVADCPIDQALWAVVRLLPMGLQHASAACARIRIDKSSRTSSPFRESPWHLRSDIVVAGRVRGVVEVYYMETGPLGEEGPFLSLERQLVDDVAQRVSQAVQLASAEARVHHLETVLRTLRSAHQLALGSDEPSTRLERACREIVATRGVETGWVYLNPDALGRPRIIEHGWGEAFDVVAEMLRQGQLPRCYRRSLETRKIVTIGNPPVDCGDCPLATQHGSTPYRHHEALGTVLQADGKDYGFICISMASDLVTGEDREALVAELADDITCTLRAIDAETERLRADEAVKKVALRHQILMNASKEGIAIINQHHQVVEANRAFGERLGYEPDEVLNLHTWDWDASMNEADVRAAFSDLTTTSGTFETRHRCKDGSLIDTEVSAHGALVGGEALVFTISRDLTEKKHMQASLAQSDRLATMGMLAAGVAHEVNNPLAYVLSSLESLSTDMPRLGTCLERCHRELEHHLGAEAASELLGGVSEPGLPLDFKDIAQRFEDALSGARRIRSIARSLSTFARVERDELVAVDIHDTIDSAANMAYNEIKFRARLFKDYGSLEKTLASEGCLSQVFLNLLINAAHAIDEGNVAANEIRIRTWQDGREACIEVSDTGQGIPKENLDRVFEPFFSTKIAGVGSGLGLPISRNIVESYAGRIEVQSEYGQGSSFVVRLPTGLPEPARAPTVTAGPPLRPVRGRIMIVDDEPAIRRTLARLLRPYDVVAVSSGDAAIRLLTEDQRFDLIVCDVIMPAVSGPELHRWLRTHHPALARRVVFITGGAFASNAAAYLASSDNICLQKPFDAAVLTRTIAELIVKYRGRD